LILVASYALSAASLHRLDGTTISTEEAASFARRTLEGAHVTGAQVAILDGGQLVWSDAFGRRGRDPDLPMNRETITWAASITKSVFATYVMQLVERHEFNLDLPVAKQLPQPLDTYAPYRDSAADLVKDPNWPLVTPRMLLAHSGGLLNFASIEQDKKMHLHSKPGTQFLYSGEGINIVQFVIEQQKGRPLDQLMQEAIFTPLGMSHTGIVFRKEFADNIADRFDSNERFISQTRRFPARAAGSMSTTAEDLARFASALFEGRIVKPATRSAMFNPFISVRSLHQFPSKPDEPDGTEGPAVGLSYGAGWGLLTKTPFGPAFFKEGHGDGAQNYMICFERRKACMILLTNSDNGEIAFRPLLEKIFGDTVTPWEWEGYNK
jgi:CubicO group peptidase (beta-lactamase class C family)